MASIQATNVSARGRALNFNSGAILDVTVQRSTGFFDGVMLT